MDVIITGRRIHYQKVTKKWLDANGVKYDKLVMYPNKIKKNDRPSAQYKAKVINELGVSKYYEDDRRIAEFLERNCPNTEIVFVVDGN